MRSSHTGTIAFSPPGPRSFVAGNNNYVLYLQPATFLEAVTSCANRQFPGGATGSLLPVADLATLLARLSLTNQDLLQVRELSCEREGCTCFTLLYIRSLGRRAVPCSIHMATI